ncbi:hypothetical protein ACH5RR_002479 [Cinchona calisaya]|uniref:Smr domain-containing protein n=1 Tax=Cinchona calisaya TaxID=153742 RepID=A0ABD3B703_9GENT
MASFLVPTALNSRCYRVEPVRGALSKQSQRFLTSLATTSAANSSSSAATHRSLRKFVKSSSKHVVLSTLSHLLSPTATLHPQLSSLAFPLYLIISEEASWFSWNAKLLADVIAVMYKQERFIEAESLILEAVKKLGGQDRDLCNFYCYLINSNSKHQSKKGVVDSIARLRQLMRHSSSVYVQKRAYESMISGLCEIGLAREAEDMMEETRSITTTTGLKPSGFEFRCLVYAYGRLGLFEDVRRNVNLMESEGFELDTVCSNMVLSSLGAHNHLSEMVSWLQRMKKSEVSFSIRTYNSVLNSCPTLMLMLQDPKSVPLSIEELMSSLGENEASLVKELVASSSVLDGVMEWNSSELKLDLHGMHLGSACLVFLQWINEVRLRFLAGDQMVPAEMTVVCGSGKHSTTRGESPVKKLLKEMILGMNNCPLKIDRGNVGCFVCKGKVFRDWLFY